ncbi:hypothetical protein L1987_38217 [Smallanthus sonchifolius]|uniref:Uncharacterized protein n=1 Tax=Smallanthus sonchifolius TaxID=185202 RepID=A0ACB9HIF8_9ASTR|nr:hypothetical protein L1987_38217 [Smallanthus sonchifolius]
MTFLIPKILHLQLKINGSIALNKVFETLASPIPPAAKQTKVSNRNCQCLYVSQVTQRLCRFALPILHYAFEANTVTFHLNSFP